MAFDYKKEYKEFYMPKGTPSIVTVPKMNYIAVRGSGNPNDEGVGAWHRQKSIWTLSWNNYQDWMKSAVGQ